MIRGSLCTAALAAAIAAAGCSGSNGAATPTSPSVSTSGGGSTSPQPSCTAPAPPTNLQLAFVQGTTVSFTWSGVGGATEYLVLIGVTSGNSEELFTNTTQTNYTYGGARPGKHYARVQSKNACGTSGSSNQVEFTIQS
jgi:ABC-type glycerol-3-phosphate transport system substrate-binding protein